MKRLTSKDAYYAMLATTILLAIGVISSAALVNHWLGKRADKLVAVKLENRLLDEQQTALRAASKTVQKYKQLDSIAQTVVPQDKDQAKAVRELVKIASDSGVKLGTVSFPASTLGQATAKGAASATPAGITQVKPVVGIPGIYEMEINVQQDNSSPTNYDKLIDFLTKLENNRRTAQVTNVTVQPTPQDRTKLTFSLILNTYIKP